MDGSPACFQGKWDHPAADARSRALHVRTRRVSLHRWSLERDHHPHPLCSEGTPRCATAGHRHWSSPRSQMLPKAAAPAYQSLAPAKSHRLQPASKTSCYNLSFKRRTRLEVVALSVLSMICIVPYVCCIRHHAASQIELGRAGNVESGSMVPKEDMDSVVSGVVQRQVAQMEYQKMLEAMAVPYLTPDSNLESSTAMRDTGDTADGTESQLRPSSMVDLGSVLTRGAEGPNATNSALNLRMPQDPRNSHAPTQAPFSFINWGQVGGMMQSPVLAHTGVPVYVPRQAVGTTVGLDFDSPATFHGPLLVALMVSVLVFFVVLMLCCWMVKSKQKHDKFMAEKIPRS